MKVRIGGAEYEGKKWDGKFTDGVREFTKSDEECPYCEAVMAVHGMTRDGETVCPGDFLVETEGRTVVVDAAFIEEVGSDEVQQMSEGEPVGHGN